MYCISFPAVFLGRNPNGDIRPWCIVNVTNYQQNMFCDVPFCDGDKAIDTHLCGTLRDRYQDDYRGKINETESGRQCQRWDSQFPHEHNNTPEEKPESGLESNYCRNPDQSEKAWCYTTDNDTRWEFCRVPFCEVLYFNDTNATGSTKDVDHGNQTVVNSLEVCGTTVLKQADYRGVVNVSASGRTCQRWDSQYPQKHNDNTPEGKPHAGLVDNYCECSSW